MNTLPKISLGIFPTPLYKLNNISRELGTNVWIKRDDMTGVGLGGNKVRKLEYLLAEAKQQGYELVMTTGGAQSNHAMLTAACALRLGMEPILVLKKRGICTRRGNQVLNYLMGVDVRFVDTDSYDDIYAEMDRIAREEKHKPVYKIPCGGSNALGALGYVDCMKEISGQGQHFDHIVCACGSGGTAAGVFLGGALYMPQTKITAAMVDTDPFDEIVPELMHGTAELLGIADRPLPPVDLVDMCGPGYAIPSKEGNEAIALMAHNEGIVLDTCYTGKTFAALVKMAREGCFKKDENVLFIHTGGAGGLFAPDWEHM
jgi:D-cysteine desulfhydrase family pyridoxal phosphate-dependent enzyme